MKKNTYRLLLVMCFSFSGIHVIAQNKSDLKTNKVETSNEVTPLKPKDGNPYVFSSKEDLDKAQSKKIAILEEIKSTSDEKRIIVLRENLWRIENGKVETKTSK